jgi:uronate dehydrogenase
VTGGVAGGVPGAVTGGVAATGGPARILITGAAGALGRLLRTELAEPGRTLVLLDVAAQTPAASGEAAEIVTASIEDLEALLGAMAPHPPNAIVHLAGLIDGHSWEDYCRVNITGTYNVLEAARRAGVPRILYASSNHAVGFTEHREGSIAPDYLFPRPDSLYGVGKAAGEALASLYHDRHGLDVVCARIGSCRPVPDDARCLWSWLSYPDFVALVRAALTVSAPGFRVVWGVSDNTRGWWSLQEGRAIGYEPQDDAEPFAAAILAAGSTDADRLGGPYTAPGFDAAGRTS